jgi:hypothetical protein
MAIYRVNTSKTTATIRQHRAKRIKRKEQKKKGQGHGSATAFTLKHELLKISVHLQTAFAAGTHLAEGQWL